MGERHLVSSANNSGMDCDTHSGRSLMNGKNSRGSRLLPWATPERTGNIEELEPLMDTCWTLLLRYSQNHFYKLPVIPIFQIFESNSW